MLRRFPHGFNQWGKRRIAKCSEIVTSSDDYLRVVVERARVSFVAVLAAAGAASFAVLLSSLACAAGAAAVGLAAAFQAATDQCGWVAATVSPCSTRMSRNFSLVIFSLATTRCSENRRVAWRYAKN